LSSSSVPQASSGRCYEIYFSVSQRNVLQANNFNDLDELERTLLAFGRHYE